MDDKKPSLRLGASQPHLRFKRQLKDHITRYGVSLAGIGVIGVLALMFVYLMVEVYPLFRSARVGHLQTQNLSMDLQEGQTLHFSLERYGELGVRINDRAQVQFFELKTGQIIKSVDLPRPEGGKVTSFAHGEQRSHIFALGFSSGQVLVAQYAFDLSYASGERQLLPKVEFPAGREFLDLSHQPIRHMAIQAMSSGVGVVALDDAGQLQVMTSIVSTNIFTGETETSRERQNLPALSSGSITHLIIDRNLRNLIIADEQGYLNYMDISQPSQAQVMDRQRAVDVRSGETLTALNYLLGTVSLITGSSHGNLDQWFLVRQEDNSYQLRKIRSFKPHSAAVHAIVPEYIRKGFATLDAQGQLGVHFTTSSQTLLMTQLSTGSQQKDASMHLALSPVNQSLAILDGEGNLSLMDLDNPHPEISMSSLWGKVWYEGRSGPEYVWQASSATDEFEPKMSFMPLSIGTLKAAFFAMLFAIPLAIMGAVYSAYFMTSHMRRMVKPTIEIMEALPTIILGFLAGLWLAPFIERNLPVVFSILILLPLTMLLTSYWWTKIPGRSRMSKGWEAALLVPTVVIVGYLCVQASPYIELWFFHGSMRQWLTDVGITYDQRNALVVGIAMGFAVIPTIFSIAEDAVFNVPKHLSQGALALGATPWQTMVRVVLLTASPGIFSAVMIGFGRAVGETMIVLMATGNSPVVNFNIFEGMRTLSANIAVELPETAVGSTHYRVLFLAGLLLFVLTFVVNTVAEVVRQRLRKRYSSI